MFNLPTCPPDCQEKHNDTRVIMAEIKQELNYIKEGMEENKKQHSDILKALKDAIEIKADKEELDDLRAEFKEDRDKKNMLIISFLCFIIVLLLGISGYLIRTHYIH